MRSLDSRMLETLGVTIMSETSGDKKKGEVTPVAKSEVPQKKPDLKNPIRRMLERAIPTGAQNGEDSAK